LKLKKKKKQSNIEHQVYEKM